MANLIEVDKLEIRVLVNDQIDNIGPSWHPEVDAPGRLTHLPLHRLDDTQSQSRVFKGEKKHTLLFDAGPEGEIWKKNVQRLQLEQAIGDIEAIHLSHWHRDHSGGLEEAVRMISKARQQGRDQVVLSLHPDRPMFRGIMTPKGPISLEADPSFSELTAAGAAVSQQSRDHTILEDMFFVSGPIPRSTSYETGFPNGIRFDSSVTGWQNDELIQDERFVMCNLKGRGLVVFTGCGHAGVVNTTRYAVKMGGDTPLFAVVGGFHLTDAKKEKLSQTVSDLKELAPKVLMPGHCSGWRFSVEAEKVMSDSVVPIYGGQLYRIS